MTFTETFTWTATKVTIAHILASGRYEDDMFIENKDDVPFKYNSDWFVAMNPRKELYVLENEEITTSMTE